MSNSSTAATTAATGSLGRPAPTSFNAMPMLPPQQRTQNIVNPRNFLTRGRNASRSKEAQSRSRGPKRSHHGPNSNGNNNLIGLNPNPDSNPDTYAQHRERASSLGSQLPSPTTANPNGQANQNSVLQTTNQTLAQSEFARLHQQMIQERRQQQLAREEAAKLKERIKTALAKAIGWAIAASSRPDLDQADPLPDLQLVDRREVPPWLLSQASLAQLRPSNNPEKAVLSSPNNPEATARNSPTKPRSSRPFQIRSSRPLMRPLRPIKTWPLSPIPWPFRLEHFLVIAPAWQYLGPSG
jgi:hypothetical protein